MSPLQWTSKSIRAWTAGLRGSGHRVSDFVVRRLLAEGGYSLQANAKTIEGNQHVDRDAQFAYLAAQAQAHMASGDPVISVDTKKKELVGTYKNAGREWHPEGEPEHVKVHDSSTPPSGKPTRTASTTLRTTSGGCRSAPTTTPPRLQWKPSAVGGNTSAGRCTRRPPGC